MGDMTESKWKLFRKVREAALDRFCERVMSEVGDLLSQARGSHHDRYLAVNAVKDFTWSWQRIVQVGVCVFDWQ
jgi:hypothetical protein